MATTTLPAQSEGWRREVVLVVLASLATAGLMGAGAMASAGTLGPAVGTALSIALLLGGLALVMTRVWRLSAAAGRAVDERDRRIGELERRLAITEAVVGGEPQVVVLWDKGLQPVVVTQSLRGVRGLPHEPARVLAFSGWLEAASSEQLHGAIDQLLRLGRPFNVLLTTSAGGQLEADGRAAAGRAVVRLRDIAGYKHEISRIAEGHKLLSRDIIASRAIMNALPSAVWLRDASGRLTWVNAAYVRAVEADNEREVLDRQVELLDLRQREQIAKALAAAPTCQRRLKITSGAERRMHEVIVLRLQDASAAVAIDVSAVQSVEDELQRQEAAFVRTLNNVATAIAIFSAEQRLVFFNDAYLKLWDLDPTWLKSQPTIAALFDRLRELGRLPEMVNYPEWRAKVLSTHETGDEGDRWWHLPGGRIVHLIADERGDGGFTHLYVDETERQTLMSRFNALTNLQAETIDSLKEGVAVFATDGRLKLSNTAFESIWKLPADVLGDNPHIDRIIEASRPLYPDTATWNLLKRSATAISDTREASDGRMDRTDGTVIDYAVMPLPDGSTLMTFADVTTAQRYERLLIERNEALVTAARTKNRFIESISYELRTPLTSIIGFTDFLMSPYCDPLTVKQREYLGDIAMSSSALRDNIDSILELTTIDAGHDMLKPEPVDVRELVHAAVDAVGKSTRRTGIVIDVGFTSDVGTIRADRLRLQKAIEHLISNAVGFSHEGGTVFVNTSLEDGRLVLSVEDTGVGIPAAEQQRVFERFESSSRGSKHRGPGLGLPIAKGYVELHGGEIRLVSEEGRGTRVTISVPAAGPPGEAVQAPPAGSAHDTPDAASEAAMRTWPSTA
ncbi:MAG: PAS-domain containing protein [Hyphomicrobiaceae bacterium]|nr:PAS-domain containing protein [Hyphomicrobiaceae bacterium]